MEKKKKNNENYGISPMYVLVKSFSLAIINL